jgi:glycosyltransferase involved in cell wall biosynthesis
MQLHCRLPTGYFAQNQLDFATLSDSKSLSCMRIALLTGEYPPQPGGIGDYTEQLGHALVARGHTIFVFTIANGQFQILDLTPPTGIAQSAICNLQSNWGWRSWKLIESALEQTHPDILHIQYQTGAYGMRPAINLLPWRLRARPNRPRVVVTAHDLLLPYLFPKAGLARRWVTHRILADPDALIVTNAQDYAQVTSARPNIRILIPIGSNIAVAPPPDYDRAAWRTVLGVSAGDTLVAYFGLLSHTKGLGVLLDALARLPDRIRLLIIGGAATAPADQAYAEHIRQRIDQLQLSARVTITGHCSPDRASAHLLAADLAALPFTDGASFRRGSLLAALAHGLPTVTTRSTSDEAPSSGQWSVAGRQLVDGDNVLLVPPSDTAELAGAIERLAADAQLRGRLADGARALAQNFAWPGIAEQHERLYTQLLGATSPRSASSRS